ncbi:hypothetical protein EDB87DRAFT_1694500 [Lactarius vividus]|nr:hypothetical protein EDB87DRAFT_1694500 [Lactarius vividus]
MHHPDPLPDPPSDNNSYLFDLYSTPPPFPTTNNGDSLIIESPQNNAVEGNSTLNNNNQQPPSETNTYLFDLFTTPPASQIHSEQSITSPISPQDSQMGSPESEEPTDHKLQPEEIVVFPRSASHTPQVRSRPLSTASNWSRASEEDPTPSNPWWKCDLSNVASKSEVVECFHLINKDLKDEINWEINDTALSYGQYYLNELKLALRPQHDFVLKQNQLQTAALVVIQALDTGATFHPGETSNTFLTPQL